MLRRNGFTLIEILVAMTIIAVSVTALVQAAGASAFRAEYLRAREYGRWIATNKLTELQVLPAWPDVGTVNTETQMGGRTWHIRTVTQKVEDPDCLRWQPGAPAMKRAAGFTLIELLVAVFLLAVLGAAGFNMLFQMNATRDRVFEQSDRLVELQRTFYWMTEDISLIADRPVRSAVDEKIPAVLFSLQGSSLLQLTRAGWTNPAREVSPARSDLQRVAYSIG